MQHGARVSRMACNVIALLIFGVHNPLGNMLLRGMAFNCCLTLLMRMAWGPSACKVKVLPQVTILLDLPWFPLPPSMPDIIQDPFSLHLEGLAASPQMNRWRSAYGKNTC